LDIVTKVWLEYKILLGQRVRFLRAAVVVHLWHSSLTLSLLSRGFCLGNSTSLKPVLSFSTSTSPLELYINSSRSLASCTSHSATCWNAFYQSAFATFGTRSLFTSPLQS